MHCHIKLRRCKSSTLQMSSPEHKDKADADQHSQVDVLEGAQEVALKQQVLQCWETSQVMQLSDMVGGQN